MNKSFQSVFPDNTIAQTFLFGAGKIRYMTNYGTALYFKGLLINSIKKSDYFVASFE